MSVAASGQPLRFKVEGMDCPSCAIKIENAVKRLPGAGQIAVNVGAGTVAVTPVSGAFVPEDAAETIRKLGYQVLVTPSPQIAPPESRQPIRFSVEGMDCPSCAIKIENALKRSPGVGSIAVNVGAGTVAVTPISDAFVAEDAAETIRRLGFKAQANAHQAKTSQHSRDKHDHEHAGHDHGGPAIAISSGSWWQTSKGRLVLVAGALLAIAFIADQIVPALGPWPFAVATLVSLVPVARRAFSAARYGSVFTIEMLMTIAAVGALAINAAEEAAVVVFLFCVGELLEGVAAMRARKSITALGDLTPKTAMIVDGTTLREVQADTLQPGHVTMVRPGDRIPSDGEILEGSSDINEAPITGESVPKAKAPGDTVFAGTINQTVAIKVKVTKAASDNTIARILRLVEEAQESKAPVERFIDRFARLYMPFVVGIAVLVAIVPPLAFGQPWGEWVYRALALLLIACPCALVISTPAAIAAGLAVGARRGLLIKGGAVLEGVGRLRTIAFDKTGTLTEGNPKVTDIVDINASPEEALRLAAALEKGSNHPIAKAILARADRDGQNHATAQNVASLGGHGLTGVVDGRALFLGNPRSAAQQSGFDDHVAAETSRLESEGKTVAVLIEGKSTLALIALRDEPREDAKRGLAALSALGVQGVMLTGDNARAAAVIARELGVEPRAELLPEDKARIVNELKAGGYGPVGKVGDGINDAPALAAADVGIAMGGGTDVALETADAALLNNRVMGVAELVRLSRATLSNVHVNVALALGSKAIFLVTTVLGMTGMWVAIMADTGATVLVTLNALRLLAFRFDKP
jgi:Cd2+/Zn2+-exporting ATPase